MTSQALTKEATVAVPAKEPEVVQSDEAIKFLKIINISDYKVIDKLHHTPSKIAIFSLLLNS